MLYMALTKITDEFQGARTKAIDTRLDSKNYLIVDFYGIKKIAFPKHIIYSINSQAYQASYLQDIIAEKELLTQSIPHAPEVIDFYEKVNADNPNYVKIIPTKNEEEEKEREKLLSQITKGEQELYAFFKEEYSLHPIVFIDNVTIEFKKKILSNIVCDVYQLHIYDSSINKPLEAYFNFRKDSNVNRDEKSLERLLQKSTSSWDINGFVIQKDTSSQNTQFIIENIYRDGDKDEFFHPEPVDPYAQDKTPSNSPVSNLL